MKCVLDCRQFLVFACVAASVGASSAWADVTDNASRFSDLMNEATYIGRARAIGAAEPCSRTGAGKSLFRVTFEASENIKGGAKVFTLIMDDTADLTRTKLNRPEDSREYLIFAFSITGDASSGHSVCRRAGETLYRMPTSNQHIFPIIALPDGKPWVVVATRYSALLGNLVVQNLDTDVHVTESRIEVHINWQNVRKRIVDALARQSTK